MYIAILSGILAKLYDDLEDNSLLSQFKTPLLMEILKGLEYVSFTVISLADPLFLLILYFVACLNNVADKTAFIAPYEKSLFFSYFLLFFVIDYSKINTLGMYEYVLLTILFLGTIIETSSETEYSVSKFIVRLISGIILFSMSFLSMFSNLKSVLFYIFGYTFCSSIVQAYSLLQHKEQKEKKESN
jgi:hypothetical protein